MLQKSLRLSLLISVLHSPAFGAHAHASHAQNPAPPHRGVVVHTSRRGVSSTDVERTQAVSRGLRFIYRTALDEENFAEYGSDYLWCFYSLSAGLRDAGARRAARRMGVEQARRWRLSHSALPPEADAATVIDFAFGNDAARSLGLHDAALDKQLRRAAARFTARALLLYDPLTEPPPADVPDECEFDRSHNPRGARACRACGRALKMRTRQDVWYDALITAYTGERSGIKLGATYADVFRWLPSMRPYRAGDAGADDTKFYDTVYAITHVVYTLNDYNAYRLSPRWLPREYEFLKASLRTAVARGDADMLGEIMDSLRAFGLTGRHPLIREGVAYLLAHQNADGSWGDVHEKDIYLRYHPTWNAVAALSDYAWRGHSPRFARVKHLADATTKTK